MKPQLIEAYRIKYDKLLEQFSYSCMSNSKWKKLFIEILKNKEVIRHCEIHDYTNGTINEIRFDKLSEESSEKVFNDYISEDILTEEHTTIYKYIEYIEFLKESKKIKHPFKSITEYENITQNTNRIKEILSKIGLFEWEENDNFLRIYGYKK